jgi:hypothetical protein
MRNTSRDVGLCAECRHVRLVPTERDATFLLCALSTVDSAYVRYPSLPVVCCRGYDRAQGSDAERNR